MIEQTIPLAQLTAGMARCVREWILPHLSDPMARIQAEQLAGLIEALPRVVDPAAAAAIQTDSNEARALLTQFGQDPPAATARDGIEALMDENAALKIQLECLADDLRGRPGDDNAGKLLELQRYFVRSVQREVTSGANAQDFAALTSRDRAGKQD